MKHKTLYYGGHIITCNLRDEVAEAIVTDEQKILYVGEYETARYLVDHDTEVVHIGGRAIMPTITDNMCEIFVSTEEIGRENLEAFCMHALPHGIATVSECGMTREKGIFQMQKQMLKGEFPFRSNALISDSSTHPEGTMPTCLSACGITTGLGNEHFKIGHFRMNVELPKNGSFSLNTAFAFFLKHLLDCGISVQFEPKNEAEAEYALWCVHAFCTEYDYCLPSRILLHFPLKEDKLSLLRKSHCHVVIPIRFCFLNPSCVAFLERMEKENIVFSFGEFYANYVMQPPFQMLSKLLFPSGEIDTVDMCNTMSLKYALRALTLHGAMGALQDEITGSLEWGKSADFMLLSATPFGKNPKEMQQIMPIRVVSSGHIVYDKTPLENRQKAPYVSG